MSAAACQGGWPAQADTQDFKRAMRQLAGGVSVVTVQAGTRRSGFTATSVSSLCVDPPTLIACVNKVSSSAALLRETRHFGVSVLAEPQQLVAERFAGMGGTAGEQRYAGTDWLRLTPDGAPVMAHSLIALDCCAEDMIERHSHWLLIGRVRAVRQSDASAPPLLYWNGAYRRLSASEPLRTESQTRR
ncbi:flavin reductase [Pandoraea thiooxydans]|uniref:Flavin reductase like domain-containing protein n=1 Tax=Pandoraea thiooxydans TaxID=445709 RepID=A0A0G3EKH4_9BURK|nr:flavin reductase family protein [Pandoraea thiooxydans]AKJ67533.1 hypothetical protein ABW99_04115 [Pandoraea thiooxydans]APR94602.1 flavin reductase [Pandoraea thiooxydans]